MGHNNRRPGPPAGLVKQVQQQRNAGKKQPEKNKNLLGHIERRRNRRHLQFERNAPPPVPVPVPSPSEKHKYWFRQVETFVVVPQRIVVPAGKERKFSVGIPTWVTHCATQVPTKGESARSTLEVGTEGADATEASAALLEMFGSDGAMSSEAAKRIRAEAEARAKRPPWIALGTVSGTKPSTVVKHLLLPGAHCLRANGEVNVLVSLFAKGSTVKLV